MPRHPPSMQSTWRSTMKFSRQRRARLFSLLGLALLSILLWQTWWGGYVLYPFTILATWFHEMGHGLGAILSGGSFERLVIFADGSGFAVSSRSTDSSGFAHAFSAATGLLGPPFAGAALVAMSRTAKEARAALLVLGSALLLSVLIFRLVLLLAI